MKRRAFIFGAASLGALGAAGYYFWPEQGLWNPCPPGKLPPHLAHHELVLAAWDGLDQVQVWDCHVHLLGMGDSASGIWVHPGMMSTASPLQYLKRLFFLNAACLDASAGKADQEYVERLVRLQNDFAPGARAMLLAFDYRYDEAGERIRALSAFHVPNAYAASVAQSYPEAFEWIASIHPYRYDCVEALQEAVEKGARAVKWLPQAMGMDPSSRLCDRFYDALARLDMPLLTHAGDEYSVHAVRGQSLGNPLSLRRALENGVRVIMAHCASMGASRDTDKGKNGPWTDNFELFARMMDEPRYFGRLFGDVSAMTLLFRAGDALTKVIQRNDWHERLLNGSDYPLPGVMPLISLGSLARRGFISGTEASVLREIRAHNPLLGDFVLKRHLQSGGKRFGSKVFETKRIFERKPA